jgi:hypothetical protein
VELTSSISTFWIFNADYFRGKGDGIALKLADLIRKTGILAILLLPKHSINI